jgi:hypothetical protein
VLYGGCLCSGGAGTVKYHSQLVTTNVYHFFVDFFLLVIGGALSSGPTDEVELISLDVINNPVPTALQSLRGLPVKGLFEGRPRMTQVGAVTKIHVYGNSVNRHSLHIKQLCCRYSVQKDQWMSCQDISVENLAEYRERNILYESAGVYGSATCGVFKSSVTQKEEIILVGGFNAGQYLTTVEIYSLEKSEWRDGNPFPRPIYGATIIPIGDSLLLVGGITTGWLRLDTIYLYNPDDDSWTLLDARMQNRNVDVIAMLVKRAIFDKESVLVKNGQESKTALLVRKVGQFLRSAMLF